MNRRTYLAGAGISLSAPLVGCLGSSVDSRGTEDTNGTADGPVDADEFSIDGRLHNEDDAARTFAVVIADADGNVLSENEQTVGPRDTRAVPAVGKPGATRTFDVTVGDAATTETLTFDVDPTPRKIDGYVDVTYARDGTIEIEFTPLERRSDSLGVIEADPRVDTPPYDIARPEPSDEPFDRSEWNEEYLGENQAESPSLSFDPLDVPEGVLSRYGFRDFSGSAYLVEVIPDEVTRDALLNLDALDEQSRSQLTAIDFEASVLVAVRTGYGSGSVAHRWSRVESTGDGLHLHGYYTDPYIQTDDLTSWVSLLNVERPSGDVGPAHVSITVSADRRVHFNSTEGVVTLPRPEPSD